MTSPFGFSRLFSLKIRVVAEGATTQADVDTVLVVDDNPRNLSNAREHLQGSLVREDPNAHIVSADPAGTTRMYGQLAQS